MNMMRTYILYIICFAMLTLGLTGCTPNCESYPTQTTGVDEVAPNHLQDEALLQPGEHQVVQDVIEYDQFLQKVWAIKFEDSLAYNVPVFSFCISNMGNGRITGRFIIDTAAYPEFYYYRFDRKTSDFVGTIKLDILNFQFDDEKGDKGTVELKLQKDGLIKGTIKYDTMSYRTNENMLIDNYTFYPMNLSDYPELDLENAIIIETNLDSWGKIRFITATIHHEAKFYPVAYLINDHNDILYEFSAPFQTGSNNINAAIEDLNFDGLKDVRIKNDFDILWIFFQMENGLFCDSVLHDSEV